MFSTASLAPLGLAVLLAAPLSAQSVADARSTQVQGAFVLHLDGLTAANQAGLQAALSKVPTVASAAVDATSGVVQLKTAAGIQLDADATRAAVTEAGLSFKSLEIPAWAAEAVWVVKVSGGS